MRITVVVGDSRTDKLFFSGALSSESADKIRSAFDLLRRGKGKCNVDIRQDPRTLSILLVFEEKTHQDK